MKTTATRIVPESNGTYINFELWQRKLRERLNLQTCANCKRNYMALRGDNSLVCSPECAQAYCGVTVTENEVAL